MLVVAFTNQNTSSGSLAFTPPLVEKMKVELAIQDWEQADDTANRVNIFLRNETFLFCKLKRRLNLDKLNKIRFSGLSNRAQKFRSNKAKDIAACM